MLARLVFDKAEAVAIELNVENFRASDGWLAGLNYMFAYSTGLRQVSDKSQTSLRIESIAPVFHRNDEIL